MKNEKILGMFLKHSRNFASFRRQSKADTRVNPIVGISRAVDCNFNWSLTEEGHAYWSDENKAWKKMCREMDLSGSINLRDM